MRHRVAIVAAAALGVVAPAHAQVSTFTAGGGGRVTLAPTALRPGSREFVGPVFVNIHQDRAPGVADSLAPPAASRRLKPVAHGASPALADLLVPMNIGPTAIAFDPWTPVEGEGHLREIEATRIDFLERYGLRGGVRTHTNAGALTLRELNEASTVPRGVIRGRPASDAHETSGPGLVRAGR